ncbi:MAG: hypothetical protein M1816_005865 [Peltula sp. TS41687]|nr:MAG: hypothetical protein M1816_005865 [Peltula sp. TS41687]
MVNSLFPAVLGLSVIVLLARAVPFSGLDSHGLHSRAVTLADCLGNKKVPVRFTSSPDFADRAEPFNLRLSYTPAVIVLPTTPQHVSDAVRCASDAGVKVQARGGGHSYASFSSGGQNGHMVINLEPLQEITLDTRTGIAKVGGGVRLGNMALGIFNQGKRGLPHGTCPGVGVGGHFTHGGFGYPSRNWGLALDNIVAVDVVLANGSYVHASGTAYPEIYTAIRGAADSFGIVTTFHIQTHPAPDKIINFGFSLPSLLGSARQAADAFLHIQSFAQNASVVDRRLGLGMYITGSNFNVDGMFFGSMDEFKTKIVPELLRGLPAPQGSNIVENDWITALTISSGQDSLETPLTGYDDHDTFFAKSLVTPTSKPLTRAAMESYFNYIITTGRRTRTPWFSIINLYGGADSRINNLPAGTPPSAYAHRDSLWVFQNYGSSSNGQPPFSNDIITFISGMNTAVTRAQPDARFEAYLNYVDPTLSPQQAHDLYYGAGLYARLLNLKRRVDPKQVFWNPQAIGVGDA